MVEERKEKQVERTQSSLKLIRQILSPTIVKEKEFLWQEIVAAMVDITSTRTREAEDILLDLAECEGRIRLSPESIIPGVMSPEDMLKSLAIRTLSEWTGRKHLKLFRRIHARTQSPVLAQIAKTHIERLGGEIEEVDL